MLLRGQNLLGYKHYPDAVVEKFVELSIKNGIDIIRIFDALNDFRNIQTALEATKKYATEKLSLIHISCPASPCRSWRGPWPCPPAPGRGCPSWSGRSPAASPTGGAKGARS